MSAPKLYVRPAYRSLFVGPPLGHVQALSDKMRAIDAKHGPFDAAFIVGDVFVKRDELSDEERALLDGTCERMCAY